MHSFLMIGMTNIRNFMVKTSEKGAKTVVAMLGEYGSLAYENRKFYKLDAEKLK